MTFRSAGDDCGEYVDIPSVEDDDGDGDEEYERNHGADEVGDGRLGGVRDESFLVPPANFNMVDRWIYRSGFPTAANFRFLEGLKLRSIGLVRMLWGFGRRYLCPEPYPDANAEFVRSHGIRLWRIKKRLCSITVGVRFFHPRVRSLALPHGSSSGPGPPPPPPPSFPRVPPTTRHRGAAFGASQGSRTRRPFTRILKQMEGDQRRRVTGRGLRFPPASFPLPLVLHLDMALPILYPHPTVRLITIERTTEACIVTHNPPPVNLTSAAKGGAATFRSPQRF
ncbi:hypothetical protein GW17_00051484 [Ensete ventricosum]|nr:hypothetical protein GW17_00051484 [Ensete ventricosum]